MTLRERFIITLLVVVFFALVFRWFILRFVAVKQVRKKCKKWFGDYPNIAPFCSIFRCLGWDLANAAWGLMVLACVLEGSNFQYLCEITGKYKFLVPVLVFVICAVLYGFATIGRHVFLEAAEKTTTARSEIVFWRRSACSLVVWMLGGGMLFFTSWLIVIVKG